MRILGVIGGIGPLSTIEYYRMLTASGGLQVIINSINMARMFAMLEKGELAALTDYLVQEVARLKRAGAELALFASNTPHIVFDQVQARSPVPIVSIVEAACRAATETGLRKVGLFGTRFTMQAGFYPEVFRRAGISVVIPSMEEQGYIHRVYSEELVKGIVLEETRAGLLRIADRLRAEEQIDGLILGGTELPLILPDSGYGGIPLLNTAEIHVQQAITLCAL